MVLLTGSGGSTGPPPDPVFFGVGAPLAKSAELLSVSTFGSLRAVDVVLDVPGAGAVSNRNLPALASVAAP